MLNALFHVSPKRFGRFGFAITKSARLRPQRYVASGGWTSYDWLGIRVYVYENQHA